MRSTSARVDEARQRYAVDAVVSELAWSGQSLLADDAQGLRLRASLERGHLGLLRNVGSHV